MLGTISHANAFFELLAFFYCFKSVSALESVLKILHQTADALPSSRTRRSEEMYFFEL